MFTHERNDNNLFGENIREAIAIFKAMFKDKGEKEVGRRIEATVAKIREACYHFPEQRVSQVLLNAAQFSGHNDSFYLEDSDLIEAIDKYIKAQSPHHVTKPQ